MGGGGGARAPRLGVGRRKICLLSMAAPGVTSKDFDLENWSTS